MSYLLFINQKIKIMKKDINFIKSVAKDQGVTKLLSDKDINRAHNFAKKAGKENYYYALKEFFQN